MVSPTGGCSFAGEALDDAEDGCTGVLPVPGMIGNAPTYGTYTGLLAVLPAGVDVAEVPVVFELVASCPLPVWMLAHLPADPLYTVEVLPVTGVPTGIDTVLLMKAFCAM